MSRENVEVIQRLFALVDERGSLSMDQSIRQYLELHAPEVVITEAASLPYGGVHRGPEGVKRHALGFMMTWDRFQPGPARGLDAQVLDAGEHVVALWRHRAVKPSGERIESPCRERLQGAGRPDRGIPDVSFRHGRALALLVRMTVAASVGARGRMPGPSSKRRNG